MEPRQAVAALYDLAREINRGADSGSNVSEAVALLRELSGVLGLTLEEKGGESGVDVEELTRLVESVAAQLEAAGQSETASELAGVSADSASADDYIGALIAARQKLRKSRAFALADGIRDSLTERSIVLKDSPTGTTWELA